MDRADVLEQLDFGVQTRVIEGDFRVIPTEESGFGIKPSQRGRTIVADDEGKKALFKGAGLDLTLGAKADHELLARVMSEVYQSDGGMAVTLNEEDQVTGLLPRGTAAVAIRPNRALRAIERGLSGDEHEYDRVVRDGLTARIDVVGGQLHAVYPAGTSPHRGDLLAAGATVEISPVGATIPHVYAYTRRLVCTNGMVATDVLVSYKFGGGGDDNVYEWLRSGVRNAERAVGPIVDTYRRLAADNVPPGETAAILEGLINVARLPAPAAAAVRAQAIENPPQNQWDMVNLISWASTHVLDNPRDIRRAERATRSFVHEESHARMCPTCGLHGRRN